MGLRSEIQEAISEAFDLDLADAVSQVTHNSMTGSTYDTATGLNTLTYTSNTIRGVFDGYSQLERFNSYIQPTDVKFIVLQNELVLIPEIKDEIVDNTTTYKIIQIEKDPANATMVLHLRKSTL